jgi:hypothetical protein
MDSPARVPDLEEGNGDSRSTRTSRIVTQERIYNGPRLPKLTLMVRGRALQAAASGMGHLS